jgi:protease I
VWCLRAITAQRDAARPSRRRSVTRPRDQNREANDARQEDPDADRRVQRGVRDLRLRAGDARGGPHGPRGLPRQAAGENIKTSLHGFEGDQTYTEKPGHLYTLNKTFGEVDPAEYDAVYCAGGRGPEYIRIDPRVQRIVRHFHDADKPIFTICHGVQILIAVEGVVTGKRVAALHYCEPEVRLAGGIYVDVEPTGACVDGKLVSAKGWPGLAAFMRECLKVLGTEIRHG